MPMALVTFSWRVCSGPLSSVRVRRARAGNGRCLHRARPHPSATARYSAARTSTTTSGDRIPDFTAQSRNRHAHCQTTPGWGLSARSDSVRSESYHDRQPAMDQDDDGRLRLETASNRARVKVGMETKWYFSVYKNNDPKRLSISRIRTTYTESARIPLRPPARPSVPFS